MKRGGAKDGKDTEDKKDAGEEDDSKDSDDSEDKKDGGNGSSDDTGNVGDSDNGDDTDNGGDSGSGEDKKEENSTYTVTFQYQGQVFGTQKVKKGQKATQPMLQPAASGAWDFDFSKEITKNVTVEWK
ncbi:MAG: hypothetical protein NC318_13660 [Blautia sp.]|nr:hypothetical protein [Blautia sp.]